MPPAERRARKPDTREKILEAATALIRAQGLSATSLDEICARAGVTKGAFFHHFASKEELAVEAARAWSATTGAFFADAPYNGHADPLDRVLGYIDFRKEILKGTVPEFTCLVGTMVQEVYGTHPAIRDACASSILGHARTLEADIAAAMRQAPAERNWTASSLAHHIQAVLQGAFILAKAAGGPEIAAAAIDHLRRYVVLLLGPGGARRKS